MKEKAISVTVRAGCLCAHNWEDKRHSYSMVFSLQHGFQFRFTLYENQRDKRLEEGQISNWVPILTLDSRVPPFFLPQIPTRDRTC